MTWMTRRRDRAILPVHNPEFEDTLGPIIERNGEHPRTAHWITEHTVPDDERDDVNVTAVFAFAVGFVAVAVAIHTLVWLLFAFFAGRQAAATTREYPLAAAEENRLPPEPRLQTNPRQDLNDLRRRGSDAEQLRVGRQERRYRSYPNR